MMKRSREVCAIRWMTVVVILMVGGATGRRVDVGGNFGWNPNFNYTLWASQQTVNVGDWLLFRFDKNLFDVLEVNETSYEKCISENFIANITKGGRDVYKVTEARPYYFICSKGYCFNGMKLAINVTNYSSPPAPSPQRNYAVGPSMYAGSINIIMLLFVLINNLTIFYLN